MNIKYNCFQKIYKLKYFYYLNKMNKAFYLLLISLLFWPSESEECLSVTLDDDPELLKNAAKGVDDCNAREKLEGYKYCCLLEYENVKMCVPVKEQQYDKIDDFIDDFEKENEIKDVSLDCYSNYIILSALSLISLFL